MQITNTLQILLCKWDKKNQDGYLSQALFLQMLSWVGCINEKSYQTPAKTGMAEIIQYYGNKGIKLNSTPLSF